MNVSEAIQKIKSSSNTRIVPMPGNNIQGSHQIEILESGSWNVVVSGITLRMAEDMVRQATNRVILG